MLPVDRLRRLSPRPPTEKELASTYDLFRAWDEVVAAGPDREGKVAFDSIAAERGLSVWFAYWSPAETRWWQEEHSFPLGATGLSSYADDEQFGWLVPQESERPLLVASVLETAAPRTGSSTASERPYGLPGFDALFTPARGLPPDRGRALHNLVPWLTALDVGTMARLHSVPGCEDRGFNVRAVHIQNDEGGEWFGYEVYPLSEPSQRRNILAVIELSPPVVFVRP